MNQIYTTSFSLVPAFFVYLPICVSVLDDIPTVITFIIILYILEIPVIEVTIFICPVQSWFTIHKAFFFHSQELYWFE